MKKETIINNEKSAYSISIILGDIALLNSINNLSSLYNIKTHELICEFGDYYTHYYGDEQYYFMEIRKNDKGTDIYNIFDAKQQKFIAKNYKLIRGDLACSIFQDLETKKYHLFDMKSFRTDKNIFYEEYDSIEFSIDQYYGKFIILEKNGKKALYCKGTGMYTDFIYDNIENMDKKDMFFVTQDGKKSFVYHDYNEGFIKSPGFDSIEIDKKNKNLYYCRNHKGIFIYNIDTYDKRLISVFPPLEEITCTLSPSSSGGRYIFIVKKDGKYGIYGINVSQSKKKEEDTISRLENLDVKHGFLDNKKYIADYEVNPQLTLVDTIYDKITTEYGDYMLYPDLSGKNMGKVGYYGYDGKDYFKPAEYDDIQIYDDVLLFFKNGACDIYTYKTFDEPSVKKCGYISNHGNEIIFEKFGVMGIFLSYRKEDKTFSGYSNIEYRSHYDGRNLYITTKHGKKGIIYGQNVLFESVNKDIFVYGIEEREYHSPEGFYIVLKNGSKRIYKFAKKSYWGDPELTEIEGTYNRVEFFDHFYLLDNGEETIIKNYKDEKLTTFPTGIKINKIILQRNSKDIAVYEIEGKYYFYREGIFEEAIIENVDKYSTRYEIEDEVYEIYTTNAKVHESFCEYIDSLDDEEALKAFEKYLKDRYAFSNKYPSLRLVKKEKDNQE